MSTSQTAADHLLTDHQMPGLLYAGLDPAEVHDMQFPECTAMEVCEWCGEPAGRR